MGTRVWLLVMLIFAAAAALLTQSSHAQPWSMSWLTTYNANSTASISQHAPALLLVRDEMPKADLQMLEGCSQTHRDLDLKLRAEKYKKDEACIYSIVKRTLGEGFKPEADKLIQWAAKNQFMAGDMLRSMYSSAATTNPLDRLGAASVYAIVSAAGLSGPMNMIREDNLQVSVVPSESFTARLEPVFGEQAKRILGIYLPKNDTLLLRFESVSIDNPSFRSLVVHEVTHFMDDAAVARSSHLDTERRAHLEEARYLLRELKDDDRALDSVAQHTVDNHRAYLITAALIQAKLFEEFESTCRKLVERTNDIAKQKGEKGIPSFEILISKNKSDLEKLMDKQLRDAGYTDEVAEFDGLTR